MADWSLGAGGSASRTYGSVNAWVQSGNNTKSAWTQVISSTPFSGHPSIMTTMGSTGDYLIDIGIGAENSERVLVSNLVAACINSTSYGVVTPILVPILIPSGSRVVFRSASNGGGDWTGCHISILQQGGFTNPNGLALEVTYGANTADSGGTSIDPGGTADTKGSWTQLTASAGYNFRGIAIGAGNQYNAARTTCQWYVDVGLTASPGDAIIIADYGLYTRTESDIICPFVSPIFPVNIPLGSEIHVRASCSINDATDRLFDAVLYCFA